jgi:YggT family protein
VALAEIIFRYVVLLFLICVFARVLLSYFPISPGSLMYSLQRGTVAITEPVLAPLRRLLPPVNVGGSAQIDLSPIIVTFICLLLLAIL